MASLAKVYLAERPDARDVDDPGAQRLEAELRRVCDVASDAWDDVEVEPEALVVALAALPKPVGELETSQIVEVALALACARGAPRALARLEAEYFPTARRALDAMKLGGDLEAEVLQEVRTKLLVPDGGPARIVGYAGRGSLRGLLKVTATRTALSMLRKAGREGPGDDAIVEAVGERDPELAYLEARYRAVFRDAFEEAVAALEPRERNLMRLHFLRKVTLEALADMYGVHRATIVRQLARVRDQLDRATQRSLRDRLGADEREVKSVMELIRSRFDVSVERLLRTTDEG
jgi:RNA polymerase sigma-70 factor (ECF subfamily)